MPSIPNSPTLVPESISSSVLGDMVPVAESNVRSPSVENVKIIRVGLQFSQSHSGDENKLVQLGKEIDNEVERDDKPIKPLDASTDSKLYDGIDVVRSDEKGLEEDLDYEHENGAKRRRTIANWNAENVIDVDALGDDDVAPAVVDAVPSIVTLIDDAAQSSN